ncbi:signal transduction histidine kinase/CheY-like chemotaxis protein [Paucibacter oligotrophus]|uniref:Sensory/regulatory protein RpfC n=1 Tax=Roseateles oligotrophus TaxID=1769250 RepID=A0A840LIJ8_9BURK|nr:response regulator [Roseateles oligotrophus]MBB4846028.1 signal transduction histidine kinase/CheY-like chemotaxis protein [Roseateles oligotrophus]
MASPCSEREIAYYRDAHRLMLGLGGLHLLWSLSLASSTQTWGLALGVGLPALAIPAWCAWRFPGRLVSRLLMALAFIVLTALVIQQTGGDPEAHFSFFVLLAALVVYCDWRPIALASLALALHHIVFLLLQPLGLGITVFNDERTLLDSQSLWQHLLYVGVQAVVVSFIAIRMRRLVLESHAVSDAVLRMAAGEWETPLPAAELKRSAPLSALNIMQQRLTHTLADLQAARLHAEEATEAKSLFLANMSHEIRTPLNAIIGLSHLASRTELTVRQRDYISKIRLSGEQLLGQINDILDFSKVESGMLTIEHIAFELDAMLQNVANVIAEKANDKGLELVFEVAPEVPPYLLGDPLRLGQVLVNYANNAVKFTEQGEIIVRVRLAQALEPASRPSHVLLRFEVKDTGPGLGPAQMGRLFQKFSQADSGGGRKHGGTGLGLAISKGLAELMGGTVGVESVSGRGATFWFTAKLEVGEFKARPLLPSVDLRGRRVLVVDDNEHAAMVLSDMLAALGFKVETASSGASAIYAVRDAEAAERHFDIVMMDWQMPGMDGLEAARRIRELGLKHMPQQVMVTAYGREESIRGAHSSGMVEVMLKPVNASLLFDTMVKLVSEQDAAQASQAPEAEEALSPKETLNTPPKLQNLIGARILLVEDNELNQQIAKELLEEAGFVVDLAEHGLAALARVDKQRYDLVLMDMQMPQMDGLVATRQIRAMRRHSGLPIVAMTANALPGDRERCLAAGMNDYLAKPIEPEAMWSALARWIKPHAGLGNPHPARPVFEKPITLVSRPEQAVRLPSHILGLDMALGLRRVAGRPAVYLDLLHKFMGTRRLALLEIRDAVLAEDWPLAERHTRTLKGLAANIGATSLQDALEPLETALREPPAPARLHALMSVAEKQLDDLILALTLQLPDRRSPDAEPEAGGEAAGMDAVQLQSLLEQLDTALSRDAAQAQALLNRHSALLRAAGGVEFEALQRAIQAAASGPAQRGALDAARQILARFLKLHEPL